MTEIVERLPQILAESLPQKKDLDLLQILVKNYTEGGAKAVKRQIEDIVKKTLEGE